MARCKRKLSWHMLLQNLHFFLASFLFLCTISFLNFQCCDDREIEIAISMSQKSILTFCALGLAFAHPNPQSSQSTRIIGTHHISALTNHVPNPQSKSKREKHKNSARYCYLAKIVFALCDLPNFNWTKPLKSV